MAGILDELIYLVKVNYAGGSQFNKLNRDVNRTSKAMKAMKVNMMGGLGLGGLFGGLSAGLAIKGLTEVASNLDRIKTRFETAAPSMEDANNLMKDSTRIAHDYGLKIQDVRNGYSMWIGATKGGSITFKDATTIYDNLAMAVGGMKMSSDEAQGSLLAFSQMASKGKIQAEELRRQLANRMPGAFQAAADAMFPMLKEAKDRQVALNDALKDGKVDTSLLLKISQVLAERFGKNAKKAATGTIGSINRMTNSWLSFQEKFMASGFGDVLLYTVQKVAKILDSKSFQDFAVTLGKLSKTIIPIMEVTLKLIKMTSKVIDFIFNKMRWFLSSAILTIIIMFTERVLLQIGLLKLGLVNGIIPAIIRMLPAIRLIVTQVGILYAKTLLWIMAARAILLVTEELELIFHAMAGEDLSHYNVTFKEMRKIAYQIADAIKQLAEYAKQFADEMKRGAEIEQMKAHPFATALQVGKNAYKQGVFGNMLPTSVGMATGMVGGLTTSILVQNQLYTNSDSAAYNLGKGSIDGANSIASKKTAAKTNQ